MVDDSCPLPEPGQSSQPEQMSAQVGLAIDEMNSSESTARKDQAAFHARGAAPDDKDIQLRITGRREALRMPAPTMLLADRRVLDTAKPPGAQLLRDAVVRPGALADLVVAALLDLSRQERVGDRWPRSTDQIPDAGANDLRHAVRARQASNTDDRLRRRPSNLSAPFDLIPL